MTARPSGWLAAPGPWQTEYYVLRAAAPGPTVLVLAGQHGDEPAGPLAAEQLLRLRPARGTIVVVPRVNRPAIAARARFGPGPHDRDLARNFPRAAGDTPRGALAAAIWEWIEANSPDLIIDLHEGFAVHRRTGKSLGSTVLYSPTPTGEWLAAAGLSAINATIADPRMKFDPVPKPIQGSVIAAAWQRLGITGIVIETTKVGQPIERRVAQQLLVASTLLAAVGSIESSY